MGDTKVTLAYKLDGTESRNTMMMGGGQPADSVSTAKWDGPKLTIVTKQVMGGQVSESTQVWWKPPTRAAHRSGFTRSSSYLASFLSNARNRPATAKPVTGSRRSGASSAKGPSTKNRGISSSGTSRQSGSCRRAVPAD
jgi:hypothetical protein